MGKTSNEVKDRYKAKNYDQVRFNVMKGQKEELQRIAAERGVGQNDLICAALEDYTGYPFRNHKE